MATQLFVQHPAQTNNKLEQLERLCSKDTPRRLMITPYHWVILDPKSKEDKVKVTNLKHSPKFQIFEFWNGHYTRHTFLSCLIHCANMKWIRWVLLKIQSGHDSVHRRTDGQTEGRTDGQTDVIPVYPPFNFVEAGGIKSQSSPLLALCADKTLMTSENISISCHHDIIIDDHLPRNKALAFWAFCLACKRI